MKQEEMESKIKKTLYNDGYVSDRVAKRMGCEKLSSVIKNIRKTEGWNVKRAWLLIGKKKYGRYVLFGKK